MQKKQNLQNQEFITCPKCKGMGIIFRSIPFTHGDHWDTCRTCGGAGKIDKNRDSLAELKDKLLLW